MLQHFVWFVCRWYCVRPGWIRPGSGAAPGASHSDNSTSPRACAVRGVWAHAWDAQSACEMRLLLSCLARAWLGVRVGAAPPPAVSSSELIPLRKQSVCGLCVIKSRRKIDSTHHTVVSSQMDRLRNYKINRNRMRGPSTEVKTEELAVEPPARS